jgi:hypothetical protein
MEGGIRGSLSRRKPSCVVALPEMRLFNRVANVECLVVVAIAKLHQLRSAGGPWLSYHCPLMILISTVENFKLVQVQTDGNKYPVYVSA